MQSSTFNFINEKYEGEEGKISFGVLKHLNLFMPNEQIEYFADIDGAYFDKMNVIVEFANDNNEILISDIHNITLSSDNKIRILGRFSAAKNGVYIVNLFFDKTDIKLSFKIGIVPKTEIANDNFYFGTQAYYCNSLKNADWNVAGQDFEDSMESVISTAEWLGCNLLREDGVSWYLSQPSEKEKIDLSLMDKCLNNITERGMKLMWIIGGSTDWALNDKYAEAGKGRGWQYPPKKEYWDARIKAIAEQYKGNKNIIYEIWNEADWEFFMGTEEEYFELLDSACEIIKGIDNNAFVIPSALVSSWETSHNPQIFAKNSMKYFAKYKELLQKGLIDTLNIHDHSLFKEEGMFASRDRRNNRLERAGYENEVTGIMVTEAGIWSADDEEQAIGLMNKILWYRANGFGSYVAYSFRTERNAPKKNLTWELFSSKLQPRRSAIAYASLIGMLGQCDYIEKIGPATDTCFADIYFDGEKSVVPLFAREDGNKKLAVNTSLPYTVYDIYGNIIENNKDNIYSALPRVIYLVFDGKVSSADFKWDSLQ